MALHKFGIERVRPLRGGYEEWKRLGYPLEPVDNPGFARVAEATA
jgi:3-mercaptopyruvate sulfurtransferase SseA